MYIFSESPSYKQLNSTCFISWSIQSGDVWKSNALHSSLEPEKTSQLNIPRPKHASLPARNAKKWDDNAEEDNFFAIYKRKQDRSK